MRAVLVIVCALVTWASPAAGGFRDLGDGWIAGPDASPALGEDRAPSPWLVRSGAARLYGLPGLTASELGIARRDGSGRAGLLWRRLGGALWCENAVELAASWRGVGVVLLSRSVRAGEVSALRIDAAGTLQLGGMSGWRLRLRTDAYRLVEGAAPPAWAPWLGVLHVGAGWVAGLAADRSVHGETALRWGCAARVGSGLALGLVAGAGEGELGLTTAWSRGRLLVRGSHIVHPALGITHRWQIVLLAGDGS